MDSLDRRDFLRLSGVACVALSTGTQALAAGDAARPARPNILVFLTDDHGRWAQHAYGGTELKTPNLDRLAARGVRMNQAITTCPVCSPARASFFTGRMPSQHGINEWINDSQEPHLPGLTGQTLISELLQKAGYHTGLVGKWHCGHDSVPKPGFDYWFSYWVSQYPHRGKQNFSDQGQHVVEEGQQSPLLTNHALEFLRARKADPAASQKPFFLFVGYVDTHVPHDNAPDDLVAEYQNATFRDIPDEHPVPCHGFVREPRPSHPEVERQRRIEYYAAASSVDREIGKVVAELEATGQLENTLIVYTGDHGLNCGQHGVWEKGIATLPQNFLEESIRIACTVSWPTGGIQQNVVSEELVGHPDLWATLLDVAGATPDAKTSAEINSPGRSYLPQLRGQRVKTPPTSHFSEYGNARMVRTNRYKLILRYPFEGVTYPHELYDLVSDPRETVNRYSDPAQASVIADLTAQINGYFSKYMVEGRSGLELEKQMPCNAHPIWVEAAERLKKENAKPPA